MIREYFFSDIEDAAKAFADAFAAELQYAIKSRGCAYAALSGGRTPGHVFRYLKNKKLEWKKVVFTLTDERWVPPEHPDSNEGMIRNCLLKENPGTASFVPLFGGEASPEEGRSACEVRLTAINTRLDAVYIGFGSDGHFASLFPGSDALDVESGYCVHVPGSKDRLPRMSLTRRTILDARKIFVLFSGEKKRLVYEKAGEKGSYRDVPLRIVLRQEKTPVEVFFSKK